MKYILRKANKTSKSLTVTIPVWIAEKLNLKPKEVMDIDLIGKKIIITKNNERS